MRRLVTVLVLLAATVGWAVPAAAAPQGASSILGSLWTAVLSTPSAQNPFNPGATEASPCWEIGRFVAPLAPLPVPACTVEPGTKIFVAASTAECSTFANDCPGPRSTPAQLAAAARLIVDTTAPSVTVDGRPVATAFVQTGPLPIVLPPSNILGDPPGPGVSVALGWVALVDPLRPGHHRIHVHTSAQEYDTTIVVRGER